MEPITKQYLLLFNAITDAEAQLQEVRCRLLAIQQQAEELFLSEADSAT